MADESAAPLADAIRDHLDLKRRNAGLAYEMPLANYMDDGGLELDRRELPADEAITEEVVRTDR